MAVAAVAAVAAAALLADCWSDVRHKPGHPQSTPSLHTSHNDRAKPKPPIQHLRRLVPKNPPESLQHHLRQRLNRHARGRWPHVDAITVRFRVGRLRGRRVARRGKPAAMQLALHRRTPHLGFALYLASNDGYRDNFLPSGPPAGSPEEALDCAGDFYLGGAAS